MLTFAIEFQPHPYEKQQIELTKDELRNRLAGHDIQRVKIMLRKLPGNQMTFAFRGDPDNVAKVQRVLGIY